MSKKSEWVANPSIAEFVPRFTTRSYIPLDRVTGITIHTTQGDVKVPLLIEQRISEESL
ncbi:hypothetical protein [Arthrobacter oryzae]|uniref:hypothetical protein n=1 Tax=Arthrobacter oryzae TaxID=409290 RepID=UPI0016062311|nr:hypothetical protein [Arthrobacter oryzae]